MAVNPAEGVKTDGADAAVCEGASTMAVDPAEGVKMVELRGALPSVISELEGFEIALPVRQFCWRDVCWAAATMRLS
jgi:hypothetical protein